MSATVTQSVEVLDAEVMDSYLRAHDLLARGDAAASSCVLGLTERLTAQLAALAERRRSEKKGCIEERSAAEQATALATAKWQVWSVLWALFRAFPLGPDAHHAVGQLLTRCSDYELLPDGRFKVTQDWFSRHIPHWQRILEPLRGRERLNALEIGSFEGLSACWLLENVLVDATSRIVCIDPFDAPDHPHVQSHFDHNISATGAAHKVTKLKGYSQQALPLLSGSRYDLAYIDGSHDPRDTLQDALSVWPLLRPGAILIFDDYGIGRHYPPEVARIIDPSPGIDAFLAFTSGQYEALHRDWQLIVRRL